MLSTPNRKKKKIWGDCLVCEDRATGRHYGAVACEGCKGFLKRSVRRNLSYICLGNSACPIDKANRNRCQKCRLDKCLRMGMRPEAVQCERKPITASKTKKATPAPVTVPPPPTPPLRPSPLPPPPPLVKNSDMNGGSRPAAFAEACSTGSTLPPSEDLGPPMVAAVHTTEVSVFPSSIMQPPASGAPEVQQVQVRTLPRLPSTSQSSTDPHCPESQSAWMKQQPLIGLSSDVLSLKYLHFKLDPASLAPVPITSMDSVYGIVMSILFQSVECACTVPAFRRLGRHDQLALLQYSWSNLLLLGVAQCSEAIPLSPFLTLAEKRAHQNYQGEGNTESLFGKAMEVMRFVSGLTWLDVDYIEYAYLRAIFLFDTDCMNLEHRARIDSTQDDVLCAMKSYTEQRCPDQPTRFGKLLLRVSKAKSFTTGVVQKLFFAPPTGEFQIASIMADIMSSSYSM